MEVHAPTAPRDDRFRKAFLLLLVVAISAAFVALIRAFLLTILLAAIFSGVCHPVFVRLRDRLRGRAGAASLITVLVLVVVVAGPLATVAGVVANQALRVSENVRPRVQQFIEQPTLLDEWMRKLPFYGRLEPYRDDILNKAGELVGGTGSALFRSLSGTIGGTVIFFVNLFVLLYTMFFMLKDGKGMLDRALEFLPLPGEDKARMLDKFVSVTRATLKGTILVGLVQGTLAGLAFWLVGIDGAIFWGTVMVVLSIVPGIGGALVWVPAAIVLIAMGSLGKGLLLAGFCGLIVGSVDNVLRPRLVGRDTRLHELVIFFSTVGGLLTFGPLGFIIGPIIAGLFVTIWEIFGTTFKDELKAVTVVGDR